MRKVGGSIPPGSTKRDLAKAGSFLFKKTPDVRSYGNLYPWYMIVGTFISNIPYLYGLDFL